MGCSINKNVFRHMDCQEECGDKHFRYGGASLRLHLDERRGLGGHLSSASTSLDKLQPAQNLINRPYLSAPLTEPHTTIILTWEANRASTSRC